MFSSWWRKWLHRSAPRTSSRKGRRPGPRPQAEALEDRLTPATVSIHDVTLLEGDTGTRDAAFTVSLSSPASLPVVVQLATADGTATAGSDYTAASGSLTIAAGNTTAVFTVSVLGELLRETNETFLVNLSGASGATIADAQATATIVDDDRVNVSVGDTAIAEGASGPTAVTFTVFLSAPSAPDVTVEFTTANGTATAGSDYTATTTTVTVLAGQTTATFTVPVLGDTSPEANETFVVNLANPSTGVGITRGTGIATIVDDDSAPTLMIDDTVAREGQSGTSTAIFTVSLASPASQDVTVQFATANGTATSGSDYTATIGTLTIATGQTSATLAISVLGDTAVEGNESLLVNLSNASSGVRIIRNQGTATILDDDGPALSISNGGVTEIDAGTASAFFTASISFPVAQNVTAAFATADGTATAGVDYTPVSGTLTILAGQTSTVFAVPVTGDTAIEGDETFVVNLSNPTNAFLLDGQGAGTIFDNDPSLSISDVTVSEGSSTSANADFTVTLSQISSQTVSVVFATAAIGSATAGQDYTPTSGTLVFASGQTSQTITVAVLNNLLNEFDETFFVNLSNPVNASLADGSGSGIILDNDPLPTLSISGVAVPEGNLFVSTQATFTLRLSVPSGRPVAVPFFTEDDTTTADEDYEAATGTATILAGQTTATIDISILGDLLDESNEMFFVNLGIPSGAILGNTQAVGTITDDDTLPTLFIEDVDVTEGNTGTVNAVFTVSLARGSSTATVTVPFLVGGNSAIAGEDFVATTGTLVFAGSVTTATISVPVIGDTAAEGEETFFVDLLSPVGATLSVAFALGTIVDDEPSLRIGDATVTEGDGGTVNAVFTVTLTRRGSPATVTVLFATSDGTATAGADYTATTAVLTFDPTVTTQTISVAVQGDTLVEGNENFFVNLSNPNGAFLEPEDNGFLLSDKPNEPRGEGTILDDEPPLRIGDATVTESDAGTVNAVFTVTLARGANSQTVTVAFATADGTALNGLDYTAVSGTLTFAPTVSTQTIIVPIAGELLDEIDETFLVNLTGAINASIADNQGQGTIRDNDAPPRLTVSNAVLREGASGTTDATFTVFLSSAVLGSNVTVLFATADGTATAGSDYTLTTGTVIIAAGQTSATFTVPVLGDLSQEPNETFLVNLSAPSLGAIAQGQGTATIVDDDALALSVGDAAVGEGGNMLFTVFLTSPSDADVTVAFATADGTATAGSDYTATSGTLTFSDGVTSAVITVPILGDTTPELNETFTVTLSNALGAAIGRSQATGIVMDDDDFSPTVSIGDAVVTEGDMGTTTATFTLSLNHVLGTNVTVQFATTNGTATAGSDYTTLISTATIPAGQTSTTISVTVLADTRNEASESFLVSLSNPVGAALGVSPGRGVIEDNDPLPIIAVSDGVVLGDGATSSITFTVSLSVISGQDVMVEFATADGTATAGSDYTATTGTLTILAGQTRALLTVPVLADLLDEADETFLVNLINPCNAAIDDADDGMGQGTILDEDAPPTIAIGNVTVTEGDTGTVDAVFTVTLSAASGRTVTVAFATVDGNTVAGSDYTATTGTLTIAAGTTSATITVPVLGDLLDEVDEAFAVNLSNPVNALFGDPQGVGTITDNDPPPNLSINDVTVTEGDTGTVDAVFTVSLDAPSGRTVTVNFAVQPDSAQSSGPTTFTGTLVFSPGTTSQTITVPILGDLLDEADETFFVNLTNATLATIVDAQGQGTILDNDPPPNVSINDISGPEGNSGLTGAIFNVTLGARSGRTVTVTFATADGTAQAGSDYTATTGTLTFAAGTTSQSITVPVRGDLLNEDNETFFVNLTSANFATIVDGQGQATILNDDALPQASVDNVNVTERDSGTTTGTLTVRLSAPSGRTVTVPFFTSGGSAEAGADYDDTSGILTFAAGQTAQTVTLTIRNDLRCEGNETFLVQLGAPNNGVLATLNPSLVTIVDDDGTDNKLFVIGLTRDLLHLEPQEAGVNEWLARLNSGELTREQVAKRFWKSPEHRIAEVQEIYCTLLGRLPTASEQAAGVQTLLNGVSEGLYVVRLVSSRAFRQLIPNNKVLVKRLVKAVLGRNASPQEVANYSSIARQFGRNQMVRRFLSSSAVLRAAVEQNFELAFGRLPSAGELDFYLQRLFTGAENACTLASQLLGSGGYLGFLRTRCASGLLDQPPEPICPPAEG